MKFKYQPYYEYILSRESFMDGELSADEIERNIGFLVDDLRNHFLEIGGIVELEDNGIISITSNIARQECDNIVASYLSNLHLLAHKLS